MALDEFRLNLGDDEGTFGFPEREEIGEDSQEEEPAEPGLGAPAPAAEAPPAFTPPPPPAPVRPAPKPKAKKKRKPEKVVTTVRVFTTTLAKMQTLKIHALEQGDRLTLGDILDEAIVDLCKKKGVGK